MNEYIVEMSVIADLALEVVKRVIDENEITHVIDDPESGPVAVARALSDFFQITAALEYEGRMLDEEVISELAHYGMDLLDRVAFQARQLEIHDQKDNLARVYALLAVWLVRRNAVLNNLDGTADGFANLVNGEHDEKALVMLAGLMDEVLEAVSDAIKLDQDRSNPWRPWRVLNLNTGIAATRSLDAGLMEEVFEKLGWRLPHDLPGFFADGKRQMDAQNVPQAVRDVMDRFCAKWPDKRPH